MTPRVLLPLVLALVTTSATARADDEDGGFHLRLGARTGLLFRHDNGYFDHARVFVESPRASTKGAHLIGDPIPPAGGFAFEAGFELISRLSLMGSFRTMTDGVMTGSDTRLSLTSTAWIVDARWAFLRASGPQGTLMGQIEAIAGVGRFTMTELLIDRALFDGTKTQSAVATGGRFGVDATGYVGGVGLVLGYAYLAAPARVSDRLGGKIDASGHELTFGLSARFLGRTGNRPNGPTKRYQ